MDNLFCDFRNFCDAFIGRGNGLPPPKIQRAISSEAFWSKRIIFWGKMKGFFVCGKNPKFNDRIRKNWMFANSIHSVDLIRFFGGDVKKMAPLSKDQHSYTFKNIRENIRFYLENTLENGRENTIECKRNT